MILIQIVRALASRSRHSYDRIIDMAVNIIDYGADQNASDNSAAIQAAVDTGYNVYIPQGIWNMEYGRRCSCY